MSAPGFWEIAALAVIALVIFGPDKLPGMAHQLGKTIAHFKREASATLDELRVAAEIDDMKGVADEFRSVTADLKQSASLAGPLASGAAATGTSAQRHSTVTAGGDRKPPFDPDAT